MNYSSLLVEKREGGVAVITLNQPENLNALGKEISRELKSALTEAEADSTIRVLVLRGAGRAFSSGGNLREMRESLAGDPGCYMEELTREVYGAIETLMNLNKPVIAAVHGFAYGAAMNLVLACDLALAAAGTIFCESFLKLGLIPGGHATTILPRSVGLKRTLEFCLTARDISAEEALALGLVNRVVPPEKLEEETMQLAQQLAAAPPLAVQATKQLLRGFYERSHAEQSARERQTQVRMAKTADFREGVMAFFEKRKPQFQGQ